MNQIQERMTLWWQSRLPREQRVLALGAVVLTLVLWIALIIVPLQGSVTRLDHELPQLRETNASLEAMAVEAGSLSQGPAATPLPINEREPALRRSLARAALGEAHSIDVTVQDTAHIKVHCDDTDYGQWLAWLHDTREQLGATIDSISVTARPANGITGRVHADVVFGFASGAGS
jgi:type II secretory pathway component PulM